MENYQKLYFKGIGKPKNYKELLINFYTRDDGTLGALIFKTVYFDEELTEIQYQGYGYRSLTALYGLCKGWFPRITYYKLIRFLGTCNIGRLINCPDIEKITYYRQDFFVSLNIATHSDLGDEKIENKTLYQWHYLIKKDLEKESAKQ